jgi:hypothetical protein
MTQKKLKQLKPAQKERRKTKLSLTKALKVFSDRIAEMNATTMIMYDEIKLMRRIIDDKVKKL